MPGCKVYSVPTIEFSDTDRATSQTTRSGVRSILQEAVKLKGLAVKVAQELEAGDLSDPDGTKARARSQAVTSVCKAFADMVTIIRIERGKPLPGSLRPESKPKQAKRTKPQQTLMDQDQPAPCTPTCTNPPNP